jgi:8-oxo-dGTP pyrophosphatase MutT (NUDIX family)
VSSSGPGAQWLAALQAEATQPPLRPRVPLWAGKSVIGSLEPDFPNQIAGGSSSRASLPLSKSEQHGITGWQLEGDVTESLARVALALRDAGLAGAWRNEQLAVTNEHGERLGTVERAAVRPLGITTWAVHLDAVTRDGRHWVQQRSLTKSNDPGLWDTLMGGMIAASDSLERALERETWEEAGLRLSQLQDLVHGGRVSTQRPSQDGAGAGYVVEHIDWYRGVLPDGVVPVNQDGEVSQFALLGPAELRGRLERREFTLEAGLVLLAAGI